MRWIHSQRPSLLSLPAHGPTPRLRFHGTVVAASSLVAVERASSEPASAQPETYTSPENGSTCSEYAIATGSGSEPVSFSGSTCTLANHTRAPVASLRREIHAVRSHCCTAPECKP